MVLGTLPFIGTLDLTLLIDFNKLAIITLCLALHLFFAVCHKVLSLSLSFSSYMLTIIINSISNLLFYLFSGDTTVFVTGERGQDLANYLSQELIHLILNFLSLDLNKSCYIIFTGSRIKVPDDPDNKININSILIKRVTRVKFLGIIIDEHLT